VEIEAKECQPICRKLKRTTCRDAVAVETAERGPFQKRPLHCLHRRACIRVTVTRALLFCAGTIKQIIVACLCQGCRMADILSKESQFGYILEGLATEYVGIFYAYLVYFVSVWYILCLFGIFCACLVYFVPVWYILCLFDIFNGHLVYFMAICMFYV
jgi:hypothetical protein